MLKTKLHEKRKYRIEGIFWVPGYNDFDFDDFEVNAYNKKQAKQKAMEHPMWNLAKKPPAISRVCNTDITQLEVLVDDYINSDINR
jgi:hypothetical protein